MREILFRGQTRRKGEKVRLNGTPVDSNWVYGGVSQNRGIIYQMEPEINKFPVYPDTVGQYTGLTDKNGTMIFEGDIVEYNGTYHEVVFCDFLDNAYFGIRFEERGEIWGFSPSVPSERMKVIGNIYDNPELIGGDGNA